MSEVWKVSFKFVSDNETMPEHLERRLVGLTHRQWPRVAQVKKGDLVLLYNFDTKELIGPFTAASDPCLNIEPDAWGGRYPAQVRVEWDELHVINDAPRIFPWVAERTFELSEDLTQQAIAKLRGAPVFRYSAPLVPIDYVLKVTRAFVKFLNDSGALYMRFGRYLPSPSYSSGLFKKMNVKKPEFTIFLKSGETVFAEVKPTVSLGGRQELVVDVEDLERLQRLESCTGIKTLVAFPIDLDGGEWGAVGLPEISGGERRTMAEREYSALPVEAVKERGKSILIQILTQQIC